MTTQAVTSSRSGGMLGVAREWIASGRRQAVVAFLLYAAITYVFFGIHVLPHLQSTCLCGGQPDASAYMWNQAWWPHALLHGLDPFYTKALFAPDRITLGGQPAMAPLVAIVATPITELWGPIASYNVWMLASPLLTAFFGFLLCRYVSRSFAAGLFGGYVFGFSAYMLLHMGGHANLVFIFMIPAAIHLTLRLIDGRIRQRSFIIWMGISLAALAYTTTEPATMFLVFGCVALVTGYVLVPQARPRLLAAIKPLVGAGVLAAVLTAPALYFALKGNGAVPRAGNGELYAGDALGFLVPSGLFRLGRSYFAPVSATFIGEAGQTYVGWPLVLMVAMYLINRWKLPATKFLFAMLAIVVVLILGSSLHIAGQPTIPLPWKLVQNTLLGEAVPVRFALFMFAIIAIIAALWLARARTPREAAAKWALAAAAIAFILPNLGSNLWHLPASNPSFFATKQYRTVLKRNETVLVLPLGPFGASMLWQADTGMWFRMTGGYLARKFPDDYVNDPLWPALVGAAPPSPATLRSFLMRRHVGAVIVGPGASPQWGTTQAPQWTAALAAIGLKPQSLGGISYYRVQRPRPGT